jgi:hypothetical protein
MLFFVLFHTLLAKSKKVVRNSQITHSLKVFVAPSSLLGALIYMERVPDGL